MNENTYDEPAKRVNDVNKLLRMSVDLRQKDMPEAASELFHIAKRLEKLTNDARRLCNTYGDNKQVRNMETSLREMGR